MYRCKWLLCTWFSKMYVPVKVGHKMFLLVDPFMWTFYVTFLWIFPFFFLLFGFLIHKLSKRNIVPRFRQIRHDLVWDDEWNISLVTPNLHSSNNFHGHLLSNKLQFKSFIFFTGEAVEFLGRYRLTFFFTFVQFYR